MKFVLFTLFTEWRIRSA